MSAHEVLLNMVFKKLFDLSPEAVLVLDKSGTIVMINGRVEFYLGYARNEIEGKHFSQLPFLTSKSKLIALAKFSQRILGKELLPYEMAMKTKSGEVVVGRVSGQGVKNEEGKLIGVLLMVAVVTDLEQSRLQAQKERDSLQHYLDITGAIYLALGINGEITLLNKKGYQILNYKEGELLGKNWIDTCVLEANRPETRLVFGQLINGDIANNEYIKTTIVTKTGEQRLISWHNSLIRDEYGQITGTLSSGEDITNEIKSQQAKERTQKIIGTYMTLADQFLHATPEEWNNSVLRVLMEIGGVLQASRLYGVKFVNFGNDEKRAYLRYEWKWNGDSKAFDGTESSIVSLQDKGYAHFLNSLQEKKVVYLTRQNLPKGLWNVDPDAFCVILLPVIMGTEWWGYLGVEVIDPVEYSANDLKALMAIATTFAAAVGRKRVDEQLLTFKQGLDLSSDVVFITDKTGMFKYINQTFTRLYGYSWSEIEAKTPSVLRSGRQSLEFYQQFWSELASGKFVTVEMVNKTKEGNLVIVRESANPILDHQKQIKGFLAIQRDITKERADQKLLQEKLVELERINRLMIGRELRMRELKEKIRQLQGSG